MKSAAVSGNFCNPLSTMLKFPIFQIVNATGSLTLLVGSARPRTQQVRSGAMWTGMEDVLTRRSSLGQILSPPVPAVSCSTTRARSTSGNAKHPRNAFLRN